MEIKIEDIWKALANANIFPADITEKIGKDEDGNINSYELQVELHQEDWKAHICTKQIITRMFAEYGYEFDIYHEALDDESEDCGSTRWIFEVI